MKKGDAVAADNVYFLRGAELTMRGQTGSIFFHPATATLFVLNEAASREAMQFAVRHGCDKDGDWQRDEKLCAILQGKLEAMAASGKAAALQEAFFGKAPKTFRVDYDLLAPLASGYAFVSAFGLYTTWIPPALARGARAGARRRKR